MSRAAVCSCSLLLLVSVVGAGCGGNDTEDKPVVTADAGDGDASPVVPTGPGLVTQKGVIVDLLTKAPVSGATVVAGDQTVTTDGVGAYTFTVHKGEPFEMVVTAANYTKLVEQETILDANVDRGKTNFVSDDTATLLLGALPGYDSTLGILSVQLVPTGACASEADAKVAVSPAGSALVRYFSNGLPTGSDGVKAGEFPSAVIYNNAPGVPLTVTVTGGTCTAAVFPFTAEGVDYTGMVATEPGRVTSFSRVFLQ